MKSYPNLWPRVTSFRNLYRAFRRARKGKRTRPDVAAFEFELEGNLLALQRELCDETYRPSGYHHFTVHEPTERKISAAPFRDRVVHHALCAVIDPLFERVFLPHSFANRAGKGTHRALDRCQALIRAHRYVLLGAELGRARLVRPDVPAADRPLRGARTSLRVTPAESPIFVKAYDFLKWLLPATAKFPKQQRFVLARQIEDSAFAFHRALVRARREPGDALASADLHLATLRTYLRLACELRFLGEKQYEHAARLTDELGRLVGGWMRTAAGGSTATTAPRGRGVGAGSRPAGRVPEQQPDQPAYGEPQQQHAGQPEQQHRVPLRE